MPANSIVANARNRVVQQVNCTRPRRPEWNRTMRPVKGRMSVQTIRQSLKGVAQGLAAKNLTKAERLTFIAHQALLIDELRAVEKARRVAKTVKPEVLSQPEPDKPSQIPAPSQKPEPSRSQYEQTQDARNPFEGR